MGFLDTAVDPRTQSYLDARANMLVELAHLEAALDAAREGGGERAVTRHHARGKLLARERVELLVDRDSPLLELCPVAGWGTGSPVGAGVVTAIGVVEDVPCVLIASDPTVRGGAVTAATLRKINRAQEIAYQNRLPVVSLIEITGYEQTEHPEIVMLAGRVVAGYTRLAEAGIATAGAFFGDVAGGNGNGGAKHRDEEPAGADLAGSFDHLVLVAPARSGGEPAELAGRPADQLAEDDRDALRLIRQCVRRFVAAGYATVRPAAPPAHDPEDLLALPGNEPREILARILDGSEFDELRPAHGAGLFAGWGAVHGQPVAVLAGHGTPATGDPDKAARLLRHAESTGTPVLVLRHGAGPAAVVPAGTPVPVLSVRVGGWYGLSAIDAQARFRFAWPNARTAPHTSALQMSGQLDDDGVIDPRDTRTVLGLCLSVVAGGGRAGAGGGRAGAGGGHASAGGGRAGGGRAGAGSRP